MSRFVGVADLEQRWKYSRQGVHKLIRRPGFPAPFAVVNRGRTRIWRLADIEAYERDKPELGDAAAKERKEAGFHLARLKGDRRKDAKSAPPETATAAANPAFRG